jgi:sugar phosphate isomerase/epimerase
MKFSLEQHTHCLVPDAASFLRLWDQIRDDDLGYNIDAGWTLLQREYPPVAIYKVGRHLMNVHMRDIDGLMRQFPAFGGLIRQAIITATARRLNGLPPSKGPAPAIPT